MPWSDSGEKVRVLFGGRAESADGREAFPAPDGPSVSWLRQVHSARVLPARPGLAGSGDGLFTRKSDLALLLVTADCVPVLLASSERLGAAHAGWRGIEAGIVHRISERLLPSETEVTAWIGPHIGPCCYEVSEEVASRIVGSSAESVRSRPSGAPRPYLDLGLAVEVQLRRAGVARIVRLGPCTRCDDRLWSYRRDGPGAGRNFSAIWRPSGV